MEIKVLFHIYANLIYTIYKITLFHFVNQQMAQLARYLNISRLSFECEYLTAHKRPEIADSLLTLTKPIYIDLQKKKHVLLNV